VDEVAAGGTSAGGREGIEGGAATEDRRSASCSTAVYEVSGVRADTGFVVCGWLRLVQGRCLFGTSTVQVFLALRGVILDTLPYSAVCIDLLYFIDRLRFSNLKIYLISCRCCRH
jgi:hypothetical protein